MRTLKQITFFILFIQYIVSAQLIRWTPYFAVATDSVTVTFDATQGNAGLAGYTGDVYAHTGVLTSSSTGPSDWKYVKTNWGVNTPETKLTRIGTDLYQFKIQPTVRSFYNVPANETILKICFVFRSSASPYKEGKTAENGDIFLPLANSVGLNVAILQPSEFPVVISPGTSLAIEAISYQSTSLQLFIDNQQVNQTSGTTINYNYIPSATGKKWIKAVATDGSATKAESCYVIIRPPVIVQDLPAGTQDGITYNSNTSVTLSLYAPQKEYVYVMGDFSIWEIDPNNYMKKTSDGNRFWITLENLAQGTEYGFQYYVDGIIRIADPYTDKILDPWNDKYITSTTYPNLKSYPTGKTTQLVGVLQTGQTVYNWQITNFQKPAKTDLVVYELLLRDFSTAHTFQSIIDTLGYLKRLGVNAIELMPINEFDGNESWGYNPAFYFAPDKYYGPKNDLKKFVDECHKQGIAVVMDIALNHSFGNSPMVRLYWDAVNNKPATNNPWFNPDARHPYSVGYDFNHESQATKDFVDRVVTYWLKEYKIDGYRFDLSKGFTQTNSGSNVGLWGQYDQSRINIWKRIADKMWNTDPTAYVILEHFADNSEETVLANYGMMLWGNHNYNYNEATMGWHDNNKSDFSYISYKARGWSNPGLVGYMESHDEERLMYKNIQYGNSSGNYNIKTLNVGLNRIKLAAAFFFTIPGPKMIWQFGELGYDYSINYPCMTSECRLSNKPIRWDYYQDLRRQKVYKTFAALTYLKETYDVFKTTDFQLAVNGSTKRINLNHSSMNAVIIGNFDVVDKTVVPNFQSTGVWYNYFSADSVVISNTTDAIALAPGEFRIYTSVRLPAPEPDILNTAEELEEMHAEAYMLFQNYPNPFNPSTTITFDLPQRSNVKLTVFNSLGEIVKILQDGLMEEGRKNISFEGNQLSSGLYFYQLQTDNFKSTRKMILIK